MPWYVVSLREPIGSSERDELASAITKVHTNLFTAPSLFVNVRFEDASNIYHYVGGKRVSRPRRCQPTHHSGINPDAVVIIIIRRIRRNTHILGETSHRNLSIPFKPTSALALHARAHYTMNCAASSAGPGIRFC